MAEPFSLDREHYMAQLEAEQDRRQVAEAAQDYLQNIIDTGRVPFLVLDAALTVCSANRAFYRTFRVTPEQTEECPIYSLGDGQWDLPALRTLLEDILPGQTHFDDFEVTHAFPDIGLRTMLLNARKVYRPGNHSQLILLSIEDVTEARAAQRQVADAQAALAAAYADLQAANARLEEDYRHERRIAQALMRPLTLETPEDAFPGLSVATLYSSAWAESEVGGDFFDAIPLADGRVALVVGDVSGKGMAAAARATEVKDVLRAFLRTYPHYPALSLTRLNDYLCELQVLDDRAHDTFVALSLVVLNLSRSEAVFARAGIEAPILVRAGGAVEQVVASSLPLGVSPKEVYLDTTVPFRPGDLVLLSTDGLSEARQGRAFLDPEGVIRLLQESLPAPTLRAVGQSLLDKVRAFAGGALQDDACLVLARRL